MASWKLDKKLRRVEAVISGEGTSQQGDQKTENNFKFKQMSSELMASNWEAINAQTASGGTWKTTSFFCSTYGGVNNKCFGEALHGL